jgi:AraC-type transcriptional regulator
LIWDQPGKKHLDLGEQSYVFGESTFLLTSIELPSVSRVCVASVEKPTVEVDLRSVQPGLYSLGVRQAGLEWTQYPIREF